MNKAQLAKELGVSRAYVTMLSNGKREPSRAIVNKLKALGVNNLANISDMESYGTPGESRTHGRLLRRQSLYPLSYGGTGDKGHPENYNGEPNH